ncbi:MAG: phosphatidate cytidylyltransferase [Spirochaetales bacterium]
MELLSPAQVVYVKQKVLTNELKTELLRKSIHMLIALVPLLVSLVGKETTLFLLASGVLFYSYAEYSRLQGKFIPVVTRLTQAAAREADKYGFILGPITLGIGAMVSLLLYPAPASVIAIYALAFGDSISSLVGKLFGQNSFPFTKSKTLEGSFACFLLVFILTYRITGTTLPAFSVAAVATLLEAVPIKDLDNIILPMGSGFMASLFLN